MKRLHADTPLPFDEAAKLVRGEVVALPAEEVELALAQGRVLAADVVAPHPVPPFENSTVDGYAVRAADVTGASTEHPVELEVLGDSVAGGPPAAALRPGAAVRIMTGAPIPPGADAVVMLEWTQFARDRVRVERPVEPGRAVRRIGEDVAAGAVVLERGTRLGPAAVGMLASLGRERVSVHRRPVVGVLATGDELLAVGDELRPGKIRSSNDWTLRGLVRDAGAEVRDLGLARDDRADLAARLAATAGLDVLITSGGVSVGDRDEVQAVLLDLGFERVFWRVASSPGKPLLFGRLHGALVFGLPGNPVSSMVAFENFVRPALRALEGDRRPGRPRVRARLDGDLRGPEDRRHFARVRLRWSDGGFRIREVGPHGSGNLRSMVEANALAVLPEGCGRASAGEELEVIVLADPDGAE
ncbi:MAG: molybdopterin molybdotransferase MoeA [Candidatus Eiseniibacteriota bacterium]